MAGPALVVLIMIPFRPSGNFGEKNFITYRIWAHHKVMGRDHGSGVLILLGSRWGPLGFEGSLFFGKFKI